MCCILYIPAGVETPNISTLEMVYWANTHGIGFADNEGYCCKTLSFSKFTKAIQARPLTADCIIHFRLATHGSISRANCHPFFDSETGIWFAHNGVLPIHSHDDMTDSEIFFRERFLPKLEQLGWDNEQLWEYVERERGASRFIFMNGREIVRLGSWHELDGVFYSNMNWNCRHHIF